MGGYLWLTIVIGVVLAVYVYRRTRNRYDDDLVDMLDDIDEDLRKS